MHNMLTLSARVSLNLISNFHPLVCLLIFLVIRFPHCLNQDWKQSLKEYFSPYWTIVSRLLVTSGRLIIMMIQLGKVLPSPKATTWNYKSLSIKFSAPWLAWTLTHLSPSYMKPVASSPYTSAPHYTHSPQFTKLYSCENQRTVILDYSHIPTKVEDD